MGVLRSAPKPPGISVGRAASNTHAERDLKALATSPAVFAGINRRAWSMATYPVRAYYCESGGARPTPLDEEKYTWVGALLRLLQLPDPADWDVDAVFPVHPGEGLVAQLVGDLQLAGNAYAALEMAANGDIIGLHRLHPQRVTLERRGGQDFWVYRSGLAEPPRYYPRRTVAHLHLLSWSAGAAGELGTGAGEALAPLIAAEETALRQTAAVVEQGGADIIVTGKTPAGSQYLTVQANREETVKRLTEKLSGDGEGRRVMVVGGDIEVKDAGLKPADLKAPELLLAARSTELMAIGVVPISVGSDAATYATAVQQYRVQAEWDEQIQTILEIGLFRPLARYFARRAGGRWAMRADRVTCRIDLASHPGYAYLRTDAIGRMEKLVGMGWDAEQAAAAEGMDLPKPTGKPQPKAAAPGQAGAEGAPRRPLGDSQSEGGDPGSAEGEGGRGLRQVA